MSGDFRLLDHLGVTVPTVCAPAARSTSAHVVLACKVKPPRAGVSPARNRTSVARSRSEIRVSNVPCNDFINLQAAERKRREREADRQREREAAARELDLFGHDEPKHTADEVEHERVALAKQAAAARKRREAERERERHDGRVQLASIEAMAAAEEAATQRRSEASAALREELKKRAEAAVNARRAAAAERRHDAHAAEPAMQFEDGADERAKVSRATQQHLKEFWLRQMDERKQRKQAELQRDRHMASHEDPMVPDESARVRKTRTNAAEDLQRAARVREARVAEQQTAKRLEREEAATAAAAQAAEARNQMAEKVAQQQKMRDEIARQLAQRTAMARDKRDAERKADRFRAQQRAEAAADRRVLYQCPATGRVLPPECFNFPRTTWSAASMPAFM